MPSVVAGRYWVPGLPSSGLPVLEQDMQQQEQQTDHTPGAADQPNAVKPQEHTQCECLSKQVSDQLADAEVQAALQQPSTPGLASSADESAGQGQDQVNTDGDGAAETQITGPEGVPSAAQQADRDRPLSRDSDAGIARMDMQAGNVAQSVQPNAAVAAPGSGLWQAEDQGIAEQELQLEPRYYAGIDMLFHSSMFKQRSTQFLQSCRVANLGFDMMARQGLVLNFMDSLSSCCLGLQCAAPTPQAAMQGLAKVSQYLVAFQSAFL